MLCGTMRMFVHAYTTNSKLQSCGYDALPLEILPRKRNTSTNTGTDTSAADASAFTGTNASTADASSDTGTDASAADASSDTGIADAYAGADP
jgi:hypothetical protein